jgi:hypothetical protein
LGCLTRDACQLSLPVPPYVHGAWAGAGFCGSHSLGEDSVGLQPTGTHTHTFQQYDLLQYQPPGTQAASLLLVNSTAGRPAGS